MTLCVHAGQIVLRACITLLCGLAVPEHGLYVVLRDAAARFILVAEPELRSGIAPVGQQHL